MSKRRNQQSNYQTQNLHFLLSVFSPTFRQISQESERLSGSSPRIIHAEHGNGKNPNPTRQWHFSLEKKGVAKKVTGSVVVIDC
jgi:hypothetical protein